jgi:hypothetical protein
VSKQVKGLRFFKVFPKKKKINGIHSTLYYLKNSNDKTILTTYTLLDAIKFNLN